MKGFSDFGTLKCCIIGSCDVGKTSIIQQHLKQSSQTEATLGAIYWVLNHTTPDGNIIKIDFWDTAGQERYNSLIPMYTRNTDIILLTFDISRKDSFLDLERWLDLLDQPHIKLENIQIILLGNKSDLEIFRQVEQPEIDIFLKKHLDKKICYLETSARTGSNIETLFQKIYGIANDKMKIEKIKQQEEIIDQKIIHLLPKKYNYNNSYFSDCC